MTRGLLSGYETVAGFYDEFFTNELKLRPHYEVLKRILAGIDIDSYRRLNERAKIDFLNQGITYSLYNAGSVEEKIFPFDLMPRIISAKEWDRMERGLKQRNMALNLFIKDIYSEKKILKNKLIPEHLVLSSTHYVKAMEGFTPAEDVYCHICGTDLIKHSDGRFYVLEDNLRNPSGVSYVLSNRETLSRTVPDLFKGPPIHPVELYPLQLRRSLESVAPASSATARCVLLTPGQYNSAYYEHSLLAQLMGIDLVEGRDLYEDNGYIYLNSIGKKTKVDVIYRRIDDDFLDPRHFREDSLLGVPGLMGAYLKGNVTIANAVGTGISDDKAICAYVPDMIKYYLDEEPIIPNVPTYICERKEDLQYVLDHIKELVIKPVDMSGGYGVKIVEDLTQEEIDTLIAEVKDNPRNFIAQPKMLLSTHATYIDDTHQFEPRHIDLRTFTLLGKDGPYVLPGGLSRVALKRGSLIVNSSQGGGSKDTWVLMD